MTVLWGGEKEMTKCMLQNEIEHITANSNDSLSDTEIRKQAFENVRQYLYCFPGFPDLDYIIDLSGRTYEKQICFSNMVFLPEAYEITEFDLDVDFDSSIEFTSDNLRFIRKLLEAVDDKHALVFLSRKDGTCFAEGIIDLEKLTNRLYVCVHIKGHMKWDAYIGKDYPLFMYKNGEYHPIKENWDPDEFCAFLRNRFTEIADEQIANFRDIVEILADQGHGTSIIIIQDNDYYQKELKRLTYSKSGHGIKLKSKKNLSKMKKTDLESFLSQVTRIDGGLILNLDAQCEAISCIFDGKLPKNYKNGNPGRGSRYNSTLLYLDSRQKGQLLCGVVVSDDGTVDFI